MQNPAAVTSPRQLERQAEETSDEQINAANAAIPPAEAAAGEQPPVPEEKERTPAPIGAEPDMKNPVLEKEKEVHDMTTPPAAAPAGNIDDSTHICLSSRWCLLSSHAQRLVEEDESPLSSSWTSKPGDTCPYYLKGPRPSSCSADMLLSVQRGSQETKKPQR